MGHHDKYRVKGAIEFYLLMLVFMMLCVFGIESVDLINQINRVHLFKDYLVNTIDNHHVYDQNVARLIDQSTICRDCVYTVKKDENRYFVDIYFELKFNALDLEFPLHLKTFSNMVF